MPTTRPSPARKTALLKTTPLKAASRKTTASKSAARPAAKVAKAGQAAPTQVPAVRKRSAAAAPAASATPKAADRPAKSARPQKVEKVEKPKKPKLVRDSYTIPKAEYQAMEALKQRATALGQPPKKSEILRAGIMALAGLSDAALLAALAAVPAIKTGRPKG